MIYLMSMVCNGLCSSFLRQARAALVLRGLRLARMARLAKLIRMPLLEELANLISGAFSHRFRRRLVVFPMVFSEVSC